MTKSITVAGYVTFAKDVVGSQLLSCGATEEDALAAARRDCGPFEDENSETITDIDVINSRFVVYPATRAVIDGAGIIDTFREVDGVVCTVDEAEDA